MKKMNKAKNPRVSFGQLCCVSLKLIYSIVLVHTCPERLCWNTLLAILDVYEARQHAIEPLSK